MSLSQPFPSVQSRVTNEDGTVTPAWRGLFSAVWQRTGGTLSAGPIQPLMGPSPIAFTAGAPGHVIISGGTVSSVTLTRGTMTIPAQSPVPVSAGDVVTIAYSAVPTASFVQW